MQEYEAITSPPVYISPLDLGPKYADKLGTGFQEYRKTYGENYCLGQLIFWHNQSNVNPDSSLARARRGCLSLPDVGSFYAKVQKPSRHRVYGPRTVRSMLARMVSLVSLCIKFSRFCCVFHVGNDLNLLLGNRWVITLYGGTVCSLDDDASDLYRQWMIYYENHVIWWWTLYL